MSKVNSFKSSQGKQRGHNAPSQELRQTVDICFDDVWEITNVSCGKGLSTTRGKCTHT